MADDLFDVVQNIFSQEEPEVPQNVSNRLLAGMVIHSNKQVIKNTDDIADLKEGDKRVGRLAAVFAAGAALIGSFINPK